MTPVPHPAITLTLRRLSEIVQPGCGRLQVLIAHLGPNWDEDQPITFEQVIQLNGFDDALFALRALPEHSALWRHFAVDCAERVQHLMTDPRSVNALRVARLHALGMVTDAELAAARAAAWDAGGSAWDAAGAALGTARDAAWDAALDSARGAAWAAAVEAAWADARAAAGDAARAAERQWQEQRLIHLTQTGVWTALEVVVTEKKE